MESKNWDEFEKYKYKLENRYNKPFITWQESFAEEKNKKRTKKLKDIDNKLNEMREYIEKNKKKLKKIIKNSKMKRQFLNKSSYRKMK